MKHSDLATAAAFLALSFGLGISFWLSPDKDFSESENRVLTAAPALSVSSIRDGSFSSDLTAYYADQLPLRGVCLSLHAITELALCRGEVNGVLVGEDGQLAVRRLDTYISRTERAEDTDVYLPSHVEAATDALLRLDATLRSDGRSLCVLLPPRTVDVTVEAFSYPSTLSDTLDATLRERLATINSPDLLTDFRARYAAGEYIYFRTDHHWTMRGAYLAYAAIMESLGLAAETLPEDFFTIRAVEGFCGTTHARAALSSVPPDVLELYLAADGSDANFTVCNERGEVVIESGFVSEKFLSTKDKYGALLDGTHRLLTIADKTAPAGSRPRLLLAKDSFGSALAPFLARHFDIVAVNLTGGMTDLSTLADTYACDYVLVVCNRENLLTSDCLIRLE